ncbi:diguanylate cyclase [Vreelandella utahensis]|uniref:diguanylate cyclase n=1 Tax=Vreelandella halophila TaxID=86177 RepID=UPI000984F306|nr:diguanylate cyclase [Halomonas utahensis]
MLKVVGLTLWMVILLLHSPAGFAQEVPSHVIGPETQHSLSPSAAIYTNDQQELPLNRAVELYQQGEFSRAEIHDPSRTNFGLTMDEIWLAFEFSTSSRIQENTFLEIGHSSLDKVDFYLLGNGKLLAEQQSGDLLPFSGKPVSHRNHVFPVSLSPNSDYQAFLRVRSEGTLTVPVTLWQGDGLWRSDQTAYAALGLYYGVLGALFIYNLFLFFSLRDTLYLTYVGFIGFLGVGQAGLSGLTGQFLWPGSPWLAHLSPTGGVAAAGVFGTLFVQRFLASTPTRLKLGWLMPSLSVAYGLTFLTAVFVSYYAAAVAVNLLSMVFSVVALLMGAVSLYLKEPGARFFVLAWVAFLLGVLVIALHNVGVLPSNSFTTNALLIGSATEMLLLSLALADRTRELEMTNRRLREKQQLLQKQANHDPLTGLANRKHLQERLMEAAARAGRSGESFALVVIDLDRFKQINDTYGHTAGDDVLLTIGSSLQALTRASDTVARIGGDEFVLLLEGIQKDKDLDRLRADLARIGDAPIPLKSGQEVLVGLSIGVAIYPDDTEELDDLFSQADADMYRHKGNRITD